MEFWRFIGADTQYGPELSGSYNGILVGLSIAVACLAGFAALSVADRMLATNSPSARRKWLVAGAITMGAGIWAMHFTAMLAFSLHMAMSYKLSLTIISMLPAVLGSGVALHVVARKTIGWRRHQIGALLMAVGIGTMHYIGMEAMMMGGHLRYDPFLFFLSIIVAHVLSSVALYINFIFRRQSSASGTSELVAKLLSAVVMGHAVAGMHYTAMAAARFFPGSDMASSDPGFNSLELGIGICSVTSLIIGVSIVATMVDRRLSGAAALLLESESRATMIIETSEAAIISIDEQGLVLSFNMQAEQIFGYKRAEILGHNISILMPPSERDNHDYYLKRYLMTGETHVIDTRREVVAVRKDHSTFPAEMMVTEIRKDEKSTFIGTLNDISERKEAEKEIASLAKFVSENPGPVLRINRDGGIVYINKAAEELIENDSDWPTVSQWSELIEHCKACTRETDVEVPINGTTFSFEIVPIDDEGYVNLYGTDLTTRKKLEGQLVHAQKLESIGQLAAGIAHEINTPIQFIGDNTRFIQEAFGDLEPVFRLYGEMVSAAEKGGVSAELIVSAKEAAKRADLDYLDQEVPKSIEQSLEGIGRVSKIVSSMKEFSHPGTDKKTPIDLNKAIASTATVSTNEWKYLAEMETLFAPDLPPVFCLPGDFNQVILNIIVNAAHAIADVEGNGSKAPDKGTITITTRLDGELAEIRISDTGTGMTEEIRSKVFDPFFTTKEVGKGTGQGLSISRSVIVDKHGGTIEVESAVGEGSTFIIRLPIGPDSPGDEKEDLNGD